MERPESGGLGNGAGTQDLRRPRAPAKGFLVRPHSRILRGPWGMARGNRHRRRGQREQTPPRACPQRRWGRGARRAGRPGTESAPRGAVGARRLARRSRTAGRRSDRGVVEGRRGWRCRTLLDPRKRKRPHPRKNSGGRSRCLIDNPICIVHFQQNRSHYPLEKRTSVHHQLSWQVLLRRDERQTQYRL